MVGVSSPVSIREVALEHAEFADLLEWGELFIDPRHGLAASR